MNKMTKGALATGLGVALLIGGGGSLAVWNTSAQANAGTIVAGDMGLKAEAGVWTNSAGTEVTGKIKDGFYKIVPGDSLTFTQPVKVTLRGDLLKATLSVTDTALTGDTTFNKKNYTVGPVAITDSTKKSVTGQELTEDGNYTASVTFAFLKSTTNLDDTNSTYDFSKVAYKLDQVASSSD
ncbi:alternate-type signal peptide domain-containing protein [Arthrobacter sp. AOP36-C1-22]|uniref:alternate-type signal peptide domain-containing protein n=1 Tax=Arthrobacter sp. AOP36-C1-22 TaxID=3457683 RepID=UPI004033EB6E